MRSLSLNERFTWRRSTFPYKTNRFWFLSEFLPMRPSPKPTPIAARIRSPTMKDILYRSKKDGVVAAGAAGAVALAGVVGAAAVAELAGIADVAGVAGFDELATSSSLGLDIGFSLTHGAHC